MKTGIYDKTGNEICIGDTVTFYMDLFPGELIKGTVSLQDGIPDSSDIPFCVIGKRSGKNEVKIYPYSPDIEYLIYSRSFCKYQTTIDYQFVSEGIFISSIISEIPKQGNGTAALNCFLKEFERYDIWIYCSDELGTSEDVLNKWYKKQGFVPCSRDAIAEYNVTHVKKSSEAK